jgi:high-affinity nickel-transport protein
MLHRILRFSLPDQLSPTRRRALGLLIFLCVVNLAVWIGALVAFHDFPLLLGTALLAYTFGLRHAVDADHIAAIDNVTRKLMQQGKRPVAVGFFFSLGHSTIVVLACVAIAVTAMAFKSDIDAVHNIGGVIGTLVSALFLLIIAVLNIFILISVCRTFQRVKNGGRAMEDDLKALVVGGGILARVFRPMFQLINQSWHMYPLGFLFGLGFDTATEVGLLGISAAEASKGLPIWSILVFPALFTAGMSLVDTLDSILMLGAYGWAFAKPIRKLYYNITITAVSVVVALIVGSLEALNLLADKMQFKGAFWDAIGSLNDNFGTLGYLIIGIFILSWLVSAAIYKLKRYDELEIELPQVE